MLDRSQYSPTLRKDGFAKKAPQQSRGLIESGASDGPSYLGIRLNVTPLTSMEDVTVRSSFCESFAFCLASTEP